MQQYHISIITSIISYCNYTVRIFAIKTYKNAETMLPKQARVWYNIRVISTFAFYLLCNIVTYFKLPGMSINRPSFLEKKGFISRFQTLNEREDNFMGDLNTALHEGTQTSTEGTQQGKTFTQDDVNRIVQERLAKERGKGTEELDRRSAELDKREFNLKARETLSSKGYSADLLDALNCESEETFNKSLETIERLFGGTSQRDAEAAANRSRIIGRSINSTNGFRSSEDAAIRERMGLSNR